MLCNTQQATMALQALSGESRSSVCKPANLLFNMPKVCSMRTLVLQCAPLYLSWWTSEGFKYGVMRYFLRAYPESPNSMPCICPISINNAYCQKHSNKTPASQKKSCYYYIYYNAKVKSLNDMQNVNRAKKIYILVFTFPTDPTNFCWPLGLTHFFPILIDFANAITTTRLYTYWLIKLFIMH